MQAPVGLANCLGPRGSRPKNHASQDGQTWVLRVPELHDDADGWDTLFTWGSSVYMGLSDENTGPFINFPYSGNSNLG